jgi:hypothetical protein
LEDLDVEGRTIISSAWVATDKMWIFNRIYWPLITLSCRYFTLHHALSLVIQLCLHQSSVTASNGRRSPYSGFPNCPRASATAIRC